MYRRLIISILTVFIITYLSINISSLELNKSETINVEVRGAVKREEIIEIDYGSKLDDILNLIELDKDADLSKFSLNETLFNNQIINIPYKQDISLTSINNASKEELIMIPGIGETLALRIIEYRNNTGSFHNIEELLNVKGIGESKFNKIKEYISI